jgi:hypothetical protein
MHNEHDQYDDRHVRPIRLGGRAVLSLDSLRESAGDLAEAKVCHPPTRVEIDWPSLLRMIGFDRDESTLVIENRVERTPRGKLPEKLGWSPTKTETVRKRVQRKLAARKRKRGRTRLTELHLPVVLKVDPSRSVQQVRFSEGGICWELLPTKKE